MKFADVDCERMLLHEQQGMRQNAMQVLHDAATASKVDAVAISLKVKQEFATKEKTKIANKPALKGLPQKVRKSA